MSNPPLGYLASCVSLKQLLLEANEASKSTPQLRPKAKTLIRLQQMLQSATAIIWLLGPSSAQDMFWMEWIYGKGGKKSSGHLSAAAQVLWEFCCTGDSASEAVLGYLPPGSGLELTAGEEGKRGRSLRCSGGENSAVKGKKVRGISQLICWSRRKIESLKSGIEGRSSNVVSTHS